MFQHFLVTRFNLRVDSWDTTRDGEATLDDEWLEDRFSLFEKYCLPSVLNQNNKEFHWFIYFDISTPERFIPRIKEIEKCQGEIHCYFINGNKELNSAFIKSINQFLHNDCEWIITTRLDNDDMIHEKFIQTIQKSFVSKNGVVIDLRKGLQINLQSKRLEVRSLNNSFNPFISLIEHRNEFQTVISRLHREWVKAEMILVSEKDPLWIEVVHKKNKLNSIDAKQQLEYISSFHEFGLSGNQFKKWSPIYVKLKNGFTRIKHNIGYQVGIAKIIRKKLLKGRISYKKNI